MTAMFEQKDDSQEGANNLDKNDPVKSFREKFVIPQDCIYFGGHSLGPMPKAARQAVEEELTAWGRYGVEGHFRAKHPWYSYHENITESFARLVGAKPCEVVAMNTLTVNLHLMMVSFYRPNKKRYKILIENNTFPSDKYAVDSQAKFHGFDPRLAVVELRPTKGCMTVNPESLLAQIEELGESLSLVMLGNCNYLSGQCFDMEAVSKKAHEVGALCGFNLAHGAGNLLLDLHNEEIDFAVWCSYKYLNSGPGGIAGAFVHEKHLDNTDLVRFEGWWGTDKQKRFQMSPHFEAMSSAEAWQLSNPPIFPLASLRTSMDIFDQATMSILRQKGDRLTGYLEWLLKRHCQDFIKIVTPENRGSMLSMKIKENLENPLNELKKQGILMDFRQPDILRITPAPLFNTFSEVYQAVEMIKNLAQ